VNNVEMRPIPAVLKMGNYSFSETEGELTYLDDGSLGIVFGGVDTGTKQSVALKLLRTAQFANDVKLLGREAQFDIECRKLRELAGMPHLLRLLYDDVLCLKEIQCIVGRGKNYKHVVLETDDKDIGDLVKILNELSCEASTASKEGRKSHGATPEQVELIETLQQKWNHPILGRVSDLGKCRELLRDVIHKCYGESVLLLNGATVLVTDRYRFSLQSVFTRKYAGRSFKVRDKLDFLWQIACAIKTMHLKGIVHLDICPSNIMFNAMPISSKPNYDASIPLTLYYDFGAYLIDVGLMEEVLHRENGSIGYGIQDRTGEERRRWQAPEVAERITRLDEHSPLRVYVDEENILRGELNYCNEEDGDEERSDLLDLMDKIEGYAPDGDEVNSASFYPKDFLITDKYMYRVGSIDVAGRGVVFDKVYVLDPVGECFIEIEDVSEYSKNEPEELVFGDLSLRKGVGFAADIFAFGLLIFYTLLQIKDSQLEGLNRSVTSEDFKIGRLESVDKFRDHFINLGLGSVYDLALKCVNRSDAGYYKQYNEEGYTGTMRMLKDLRGEIDKFVTCETQLELAEDIARLEKDLNEYNKLFGPKDIAEAMTQKTNQTLEAIERADAEKAKYTAKMEKTVSAHQLEIDQLEQAHASEMRELKVQWLDEKVRAEEDHKTEMNNGRYEHEIAQAELLQKIGDIQSDHASVLARAEEKYEHKEFELKDAHEKEISGLRTQLVAIEATTKHKEIELKDVQSKLESSKKTEAVLQGSLKNHQGYIDRSGDFLKTYNELHRWLDSVSPADIGNINGWLGSSDIRREVREKLTKLRTQVKKLNKWGARSSGGDMGFKKI